MSQFYPLNQVPEFVQEQIGGKAKPLIDLCQQGLPVPAGFVLPATVFTDQLNSPAIKEAWETFKTSPNNESTKTLRLAIETSSLEPELEAELRNCVTLLGGRVAIRSSATDEDGSERSFAGQHLTELNVGIDEAPLALRRCWASIFAEHAIAYRQNNLRTDTAMAVIIQTMIEPSASGVLFTVNPMNGSWREIVVEATWGLGEALVSGQVSPHWYLVRRPRSSPSPVQRVIARMRLDVLQEDIPDIPTHLIRDEKGVKVIKTPLQLTGKKTLNRRQLLRLCRLGLRVESLQGEPQDLEWALDHNGKFHLLQARPITTKVTLPTRKDVLWTRRFIGERWPEPATPMGWSILSPILDWFIGYPRTQARYLGGGPSLRLVDYHPYINATVFRHLLFKSPGTPPPRFLLDMIPTHEESSWRNRFSAKPSFNVYGSLLRETFSERRWGRFSWNPLTNHNEWEKFKASVEQNLPTLKRKANSASDSLVLLELHEQWIRNYIQIHVISLLYANLFYQALESRITALLPTEAHWLLEALAYSGEKNETVRTNQHLWEVAQLLDAEEQEELRQGSIPSKESPFTAALINFLRQHGHRASASWEIFSPRWRDKPEILIPLLLAQTGDAPLSRLQSQQDLREKAKRLLGTELGHGLKLWSLKSLITRTNKYLLLRENQRYWFDHILYATQLNLIELGHILVRRNSLKQAGDIAYLSSEEAKGLVKENLNLVEMNEWIERRKADREKSKDKAPPVFLEGDEGVTLQLGKGRLEGLGISTGRARGIVRVIHRLEEASRLGSGEILVTRTVDPGWTPLFAKAGGVILELGSTLSHGAVVAREYGIPAVVNIDDLTNRLREGQEVTVDGTRGLVWVHQ